MLHQHKHLFIFMVMRKWINNLLQFTTSPLRRQFLVSKMCVRMGQSLRGNLPVKFVFINHNVCGCRNVTQDLVFGSLFTCRNCRNQHRFAVKTSFFSVQKSSVMKNYTVLFLQYIKHSIHTLINYMKTTHNSNTLLGKQLLNQKGNPHTCRNQHRFAVKTYFFSVQKSTK